MVGLVRSLGKLGCLGAFKGYWRSLAQRGRETKHKGILTATGNTKMLQLLMMLV